MLSPLSQLRVSRYIIPAWKRTPNSSIQNKPLMIYHSAFDPAKVTASSIESHLTNIAVVTPQWRYTMYSTSHFHSTSHEVLGIASGAAKLCFGCEDNPERAEVNVTKGDVIIVPAGVAHRLLEDLEGDFQMVGCYPTGCNWDMCYGKAGEEDKVQSIEKLKWFDRDPVYGDEGPTIGA